MRLNVESCLPRLSDASKTSQNSKQQRQGWINKVGSVDEAVSSTLQKSRVNTRGTNDCTYLTFATAAVGEGTRKAMSHQKGNMYLSSNEPDYILQPSLQVQGNIPHEWRPRDNISSHGLQHFIHLRLVAQKCKES